MGVISFIIALFISTLLFIADKVSFFVLKRLNYGKSKFLPPIQNTILLINTMDLADRIKRREIKCIDVINAFIDRIEEINPITNAVVIKRYSEARTEAQIIDEKLLSEDQQVIESLESLPLLGVPYSVKDSVSVKGFVNSYGLVSRRHAIASEDAEVVQNLRKAGAILLCVTNVPELCMWWETYNNLYGVTCNPYDTTRIVGGSSGGEGALIASAGSLMGVGSDIGGSIRLPAFFNGVFGHKPSYAIVSTKGLKPDSYDLAEKCLVAGPLTRYASDLTVMLKAMAGDNIGKLSLDKSVDIKSITFYYMEDDGGCYYTSTVQPELREAMIKVLLHFENKFHIKVQKLHLSKMKYAYDMWEATLGSSDGPSFATEMGNGEKEVNVYIELIKWCFGKSEFILPIILQGIIWLFAKKKGSKSALKLIAMCEALKKQLADILRDNGVFLYPSQPYPAIYHYQSLAMPYNLAYTGIFNILQMPVTQCPLGLNSEGLPLGIQVAATPFNDHLTLAVAMEIEKAFGGWMDPSKKNS